MERILSANTHQRPSLLLGNHRARGEAVRVDVATGQGTGRGPQHGVLTRKPRDSFQIIRNKKEWSYRLVSKGKQ